MKTYAKENKPDTKRHMLYDSFYEITGVVKSIKAGSRVAAAKGWVL